MAAKTRAAIYARVSTDEQAAIGYSLDAQIDKMRLYCETYDLEITGEYVDDGYSGRNTRRPAYRKMFSPEEREKWDVLIVLKMDRIHRSSKNFILMMEDLKKHGQDFVSTFEKFNTTTAVGRFALDIIQRIAQLESEQIGERTYIGMREKAQSTNEIMGFTPAFGYSLSGGRLESNQELDTARDIFSMYLGGTTLDMIAYDLNRSGRLTRKGNPWNKFNLRNILHNPVYAGYLRWDGIIQKHDADTAVTPEEFNEVQRLMASKVRDPKKREVWLLEERAMRTAEHLEIDGAAGSQIAATETAKV